MNALPRVLGRRQGLVGLVEAATDGVGQVDGCGDV